MGTEAFQYDRIGAYAVILSPDDLVLLIEANGGRLYLPGGRAEAGETPEAALLREIMEECGCSSTVHDKIGDAIQPILEGRSSVFAHYFRAEIGRPVRRGEHRALWLPAQKAIGLVHRRGDAMAIQTALVARSKGVAGRRFARVA